MMGIPKINTEGNIFKRDIIVSVFTGIYFFLLFLFHQPIINFLILRFGFEFQNNSPILSIFLCFLLSPLAAGFLSYKLSKPSLFAFDRTLVNGLTAALTFVVSILLLNVLTKPAFSFFALIGILFFSTLFSFIIAALSTTLLSRILTKKSQ